MMTTRFGAEFLVRTPAQDQAANFSDMRLEMEAARRSLAAWRRARLARAILPGFVVDWLEARRRLRLERAGAETLAGLSPHMLDDIGMRAIAARPEPTLPTDRRG